MTAVPCDGANVTESPVAVELIPALPVNSEVVTKTTVANLPSILKSGLRERVTMSVPQLSKFGKLEKFRMFGYNAMKHTLPLGPRTPGYKHQLDTTRNRTREKEFEVQRYFADELRKEVCLDLGIPACIGIVSPVTDREIFADTGSGEHLIGKSDMTHNEKKLIGEGAV